jgi:putative ABC transport system permease protein
MKKILDPLFGIWVAIITHKLRSFLTILGVVIGVAAVIALMSIGKGTEASIMKRIQSLGSNLIFVRPGATTQAGVRSAFGTATSLTLEDASAIRSQISNLSSIAPYNSTSQQLVAAGKNMRAQIVGTNTDYKIGYNLKVIKGTFFTEWDFENNSRLAVLGSNVASTLFSNSDPVGQTIRAGNQIVRVIGVLQSTGASSMGTSPDDSLIIPLSAMQEMYSQQRTNSGDHVVSSIALTLSDQSYSSQVIDELTSLLRTRHKIAAGKEADFSITSIEEVARTVSETASNLTFFLGAIAAISLLVGGIGVMNIMLVSVSERRREIGIRKALGAKERDIWGQFLIEAAFLTIFGGIIGILVGWGSSYMVSRFMSMTTLVSADIVILAMSVSIGIGIFFGFYPAWNASRLDPIDALRSE